MKKFSIILLCFVVFNSWSQELIINELSQGVGSSEYVELLTVGTPTCTDPCMDLRGWIIDDNNGVFTGGGGSGNGIAPGALRFDPNNTFWSCIPYGTLIVIYAESSKNSDIPVDDASMADGNCVLILPADSPLLQGHPTEPNSGNDNFSASGWVSNSEWLSVGMSNSGDGFQTVNPSNTSTYVHGVSYGGNNSGTDIYFAGSGSGLVFSFTNNTSDDYHTQGNFTSGDVATDQTPGSPNNVANGNFITGLNNNCSPIVFGSPDIDPLADVIACGSYDLPAITGTDLTGGEGYFDSSDGLGTQYAVGQTISSSISLFIYDGTTGCFDEEEFSITINNAGDPGTNNSVDVCLSGGVVELFGELGGSPDPGGTWGGPSVLSGADLGEFDPASNNLGVYTYTIGSGACSASATVDVTIITPPDAGTDASITYCSSGASSDLFLELGGSPDAGGTWSPVMASAVSIFNPGTDAPGVYRYTLPGAGSCLSTFSEVTVSVDQPNNAGSDATLVICPADPNEDLFTLLAAGANVGGVWSPALASGGSDFDPSSDADGVYQYTVSSGVCPNAVAEVTVSFNGATDATITQPNVICFDGASILLVAASPNGTWSGSGIVDPITGEFDPSTAVIGMNQILYDITGACPGSDVVDIEVEATPSATITVVDELGCAPFLLEFNQSATPGTSCEWQLSNGQMNSNCGQGTIEMNAPGCYDFQLNLISDNGCQATEVYPNQICVLNDPIANFDAVEASSKVFSLTNTSQDYSETYWTLNGDSIPGTDASITVADVGVYEICVYAINADGCEDVTCKMFEVKAESTIFVPNSFTPNDDGANDVFGVVSSEFETFEYSFTIYDRWGLQVFNSEDVFETWDGKINGVIQPIGVYVWRMTYRFSEQEDLQDKRGHVTIVR